MLAQTSLSSNIYPTQLDSSFLQPGLEDLGLHQKQIRTAENGFQIVTISPSLPFISSLSLSVLSRRWKKEAMGDKGGDEMGEGMQCSDHPYRNNPGGICAFCLQEKLGKLVSSSKSNTFYPLVAAPSSSASSPALPPELARVGISLAAAGSSHLPRVPKVPFLAQKQKKVMSSSSAAEDGLVLTRSRSVAPSWRNLSDGSEDSPRKRSFWSFLHLSRRRAAREREASGKEKAGGFRGSLDPVRRDLAAEEASDSPNSSSQASSSFERKVARSRSVGCGSRSFSGDFLERISTGLGDCTLRRVESQREAKPKIVLHRVAAEDRIKERVKCGGIFGGLGIISSSSYWLSEDFGGRVSGPHSRSKSWSWAFASPMRAFRTSKPSSYIADKDAERRTTSAGAPPASNISSTPSLLAVRA